MGSFLSAYFVPLHQLPAVRQLPEECVAEDFPPQAFSLEGLAQLLFFALAYGAIVFKASNLIADGSELLLLIPSIAPIVGSLVLPVLGAVPDGTMVLFSGLGPRDQVKKSLAVGVGALAGSTIILLTVPWFFSVFAGRVDILEGNTAAYRQKPKLSGRLRMWTQTGVGPDVASTRQSAFNMLVTLLPYVFIQGAAFYYKSDATVEERSRHESGWALGGMIVCVIFFIGYMYQHIRGAAHNKVILDKTDDIREKAVRKGLVSLGGAFFQVLAKLDSGPFDASSVNATTRLLRSPSILQGEALDNQYHRFRSTVHHFFRRYDVDGNNVIDQNELGLLLRDLNVPHEPSDVSQYLKEMDVDASGHISFDEFVACLAKIVKGSKSGERSPRMHTSYGSLDSNVRVLQEVHEGVREPTTERSSMASVHDDDDEEEEEVPEDLAHLPPEEQQKRILRRALGMMATGVALVLVFSDVLVEVFAEIGDLCGISGFYVAFVLAPLASNASEIIASFYYAQRKTSKTITISMCTLMGAAILNNTFVLGIFLSIIKFRELDWEFSAETIAILAVEFIVGMIVLTREVHTVRWGAIVLSLLPLSLLLVAFLESSYIGWD